MLKDPSSNILVAFFARTTTLPSLFDWSSSLVFFTHTASSMLCTNRWIERVLHFLSFRKTTRWTEELGMDMPLITTYFYPTGSQQLYVWSARILEYSSTYPAIVFKLGFMLTSFLRFLRLVCNTWTMPLWEMNTKYRYTKDYVLPSLHYNLLINPLSIYVTKKLNSLATRYFKEWSGLSLSTTLLK